MNIGMKTACKTLLAHDNILIITHQSPDGDTLGSGFALYYGLKQLGKRVRVVCSDEFPPRYDFLFEGYAEEEFEPDFIVAVDLADKQLFGAQYSPLADRVDLCIDHHPSNTRYARHLLLRPKAAATCEIMYEVLRGMGVKFDERIGTCIYTGIATDTGCFRFSNTTVNSHRIAARMMQCEVKIGKINRLMFETKTQSRIAIEQQVLSSIEYYFDRRCAVISVTKQMLKSSGAAESELEGLSTLPRQIEGVQIGVMLREKDSGEFKVSMRTNEGFDASKICGLLGGGGHVKAAGCVVGGDLEHAKKTVIDTIARFV